MEEELIRFSKTLELQNEKTIKRVEHCLRVSALAEELGRKKGLSNQELQLVKAAGLLHDYGKLVMQGTTKKITMDHGSYGVLLLTENNRIRDFIEPINDSALFFAIQNHNQLTVAKTTDAFALLLSNLIRDADKLDGLYRTFCLKEHPLSFLDPVSQEVRATFLNHRLVPHEFVRTKSDHLLSELSYLFELNFKESLEWIQNQNLLEQVLQLFPSTKEYVNLLKQEIETRLSSC